MKKLSLIDKFWLVFLPLLVLAIIISSFSGAIRPRSLMSTELSITTKQKLLEERISADGYTFDNPNIILNPYGNSPLSAIIAFESEAPIRPTVRIIGHDDKTTIDFSFNISSTHLLPIYGLYPGEDNKIVISHDNTEKEIHIVTEDLPEDFPKASVVVAQRDLLDNQLYFFTPSSNGYTCAYDINGDVRWYLTQKAIWDVSRLQNGHLLLSTERLLNNPYYLTGLYEMDLLGKVHAEYSLPGGYHHDYFELDNGNLLIASDNFDGVNDTVEDYIVELNRMTGVVERKYNLKDILPVNNTGNENWSSDDWFHNNAIWYDKESNEILLSGRHADAIIAIDYESGDLRWILGDSTGWPENYRHYFLKPIGNYFEWQWSQHAVMKTPEGYIFLFDNGNNKSKLSDSYVAANNSYSRGVMYKIDEYEMTVEQIWQYGKERGANFYSPYISDVDYIEDGHYIVHSGGIVRKDGIALNQPAGRTDANELLSDTVEIINNTVAFELTLPTNTYRVEKMQAYTSVDYNGVSLGDAMRVGSLGKTEIAETKYGLVRSVDIDDKYNSHSINLTKQEDRLVFSGTFKRGSNVRLVLVKGLEQKYYKLRVTDKAHAALCVAVFDEHENENQEELTITRFVNGEGLSGKYDVYLEIYDTIYDLRQPPDHSTHS